MKSRILLLTEVFPPRLGGSGRWMWELYRRLNQFTIFVAAGRTKGDASFDRTHQLPIRRLRLHFSNWGLWDIRGAVQYARAVPPLLNFIAWGKPDAIHCGKCLPEGLLALAMKRVFGIPFDCYVHGEELTLAGTSGELRRLTGKVLRESRRVIANSHYSRAILEDVWQTPTSKIVVMHPGVDTKRFVPAEASGTVRERLGWVNRRVILTVGALQKRKGQDMLIRALPAIRRHCPDVLYSIVGEGWERDYLEQLVAQCDVRGLVQFRGIPPDDELIECYQQCDVFTLPNRQVGWDFEGFGIVLLEAQACGKPVIAGNSGGVPETIQVDKSGAVVPCDAPDLLAREIIALLTNPERRQVMGSNGRVWVVDRFDWGILSEKATCLFAADLSR